MHAQVQRELFGPSSTGGTLAEIQRSPDTHTWRVALTAGVAGALVGAAEIRMPLTDKLALATLWRSVEPGHRWRGIGTSLLRGAEHIGVGHGRTTFVAGTESAGQGPDLGGAFVTQRGYAVAQTVQRSTLTQSICTGSGRR